MRYAAAAKNLMLEALDESVAAGAKYGSLHSAYSATGANELTGGSPAYARKALTWNAAASGSKALASAVVFDVAGGSTVQFFGLWDAVTGGNFLGMTPNNGGTPQAFVVPDISVDILECAAHGFVNNDTVIVWSVAGDPIPAGLSEATLYYVVSATTDDLKLSLTQGGAAINITAIGAGTLQKVTAEAFASQGTHTISAATLSID